MSYLGGSRTMTSWKTLGQLERAKRAHAHAHAHAPPSSSRSFPNRQGLLITCRCHTGSIGVARSSGPSADDQEVEDNGLVKFPVEEDHRFPGRKKIQFKKGSKELV